MTKRIFINLIISILVTGCSSLERRNEAPGSTRSVEDKSAIVTSKTATHDMKKRLLVLPFLVDMPGAPAQINREAQSQFISELNRTGEVLALDEKIVDTKGALKNSNYDFKTLAMQGNKSGVTAFFEGKILEVKAQRSAPQVGVFRKVKTVYVCKVRARMAAARSGKELMNTVKTVTLEDTSTRVGESPRYADDMLNENPELVKQLIQDAFKEFMPQIIDLMEKQTWEGRIAAIQGERVYLNVGSASGLQIGDLLKVMDEGQEVYDPETGGFVGQVPGRLKGTLEVISFFGQDGSISVIHSGAGFKENDRVELY
ncbi:MAG: hypothetical protein V4736_09545 [Bdellovibrionota bacterium]